MNLAHAVKQLRKEVLRQTQQEFAIRLGLAVTSISRYETGTSSPTVSVLHQMVQLSRENSRDDLARVFVFGGDQKLLGAVPAAEVIAAIEPLRPLWEQAGEGLHPSWYPVRDLYKRLVQ